MDYGFGIDIGGTTVKIALFADGGEVVKKWEIPTVTEDDGERILPDIAAAVRDCLKAEGIDPSCVRGIGLGVPGPVDDDGVVNRCINLGWGVFNVASALSELTGLPVKAGNDANVAALGEAWRGGGRGCRSMILVTLGTGVGGGIVMDGRILHGAHGAGGEIGHMVLSRSETIPCGCGKYGCAEQYCSATGILLLARRYLERTGSATVLNPTTMTCKDIFDAGKAGDGAALGILEDYYACLGEFLADICCVIDPEVVVLGGGVSKAGQMLLDGVRPYFLKNVFHAASGARFALAALGNDAGVYGAYKLAMDAFPLPRG